MHKTKWFLLIVSLILLGFVPPISAQKDYAALHGTVTDETGAVIPEATVKVLNASTGISTVRTTDKSGYYIFTQLQVGGPYKVTVTAPGFETFVATGLMLNVNDNREQGARMKVGAALQTVEVSATALQVETSNTQLQQVATAQQLESLPMEGRDAAGLQKLEPGVVESSDRFGSYSSNGSETPQNSYLLNGADINDGPLQDEGIQVNPDALEQENIVTSTMNPEFARNSGAVVNQILKAGTNQFHGSGFEFYRDTFLNNGNYFSATRPVFHQNLYGGTLGGPVIKGKFFFFSAYQGRRNRTANTVLQPTLDSDQFKGVFSSDLNYSTEQPNNQPNTVKINGKEVSVSDSLTANPMPFAYAGCKAGTPWALCFDNGGSGKATIDVPTSTWNKIASNLIKTYVPPANVGADLYNFNALNTAAADQGILRLDYTPSPSDNIWGASVFQSAPSFNTLPFGGGSFPGFGQVAARHSKVFSAAWTHTFNPNMLNELRAGYYRFNFSAVIPANPMAPSSFGFSINPQLSQSGLPYLGIGNYFALGFSFEGPQPRLDTNLSYADNYSWVRGNHSLKFGASFEQFRVHNPFGYYNNGIYNFAGGGEYSSGDPLLDFALGIADSYNQTNDGFIDAVAAETYAYAQDNWKVTPDFTFNYGIAWDAEEPNQNRQFGGLGIICWQNSSTTSRIFPGGAPGLTYPGDPGCNSAGSPVTHHNRFGPRIGFAWSPSSGPAALIGNPGAHNFSVRAGFGLYYNRDQEEQSLQNLGDPPFLYMSHGAGDFGGSPAFANPFEDIATGKSEANPYPFTPPKAGGKVDWAIYNELDLAAFDKSYSVPYAYNYNLNIQRSFGNNLLAQVGYVGSEGRRLASWYEGDNITPAGHALCLANPSCAGLPQYTHYFFWQYAAQPATSPSGLPWYWSVGMQNTEGSSNYNSLQASLRDDGYHGLQFTLGYTYSHALDDGSGYESGTGTRVRNYVPGFEYLNYGDSDFDARQRLAVSYVYTVPVSGFLKQNRALGETLGGWGIGGVTAVQNGFPIGVNMGTQRSLWCDALSYFGCPDVPMTSSFKIKTYNPRSNASTHQYFDTTPFSAEPIGTFGNTVRNFFHGPGFNYTNLQIFKKVHFTSDSSRYLELRLEAFNAFNHANFAAPSGTFLNPTFGQVTGVIVSADPNADPQPGRAVQLTGKVYF
jgi:hypothetical protein